MKEVSLHEFCKGCKSKCCKHVGGIGSPILDKKERDLCENRLKDSTKKVITPNGKIYYLIKEINQNCIFLKDNGDCKIQDVKPLDCLCYPIKAIYSKDKIIFVVDANCPAQKKLDKNFIKKAKEIALISIKRFDKKTFGHWLKNHVGWVKRELG